MADCSALEGFASAIQAFARGSPTGPAGCNVTMPFKFEAFRLCPNATARAVLAGAANTRGVRPETAPVPTALRQRLAQPRP